MKTFYQFIEEDFNSDTAKQFTLSVITYKGDVAYVPIFYEKLPQKPFNLPRYMKSFLSSSAQETMNTTGSYRGLIFCVPPNYLMFVFTVNQLHSSVCKALDAKASMNQYPKNNYFKIYGATDNLATMSDIPNVWCFPFTYNSSGDIATNLGTQATKKLFTEKSLEKEFSLDTTHSVIRSLK